MITLAHICMIATYAMQIPRSPYWIYLHFAKKIEPYVTYYKRQIKSYNNTTHNILENEIDLIYPQIPGKQKYHTITTIVSSFIGLAYEGISSFLHNRRNKALHKAVKAMDSKTTIQCNKLIQLENSVTTSKDTRHTAYSINPLLYLRTAQDKFVSLSEEFITQLCIYAAAIRV